MNEWILAGMCLSLYQKLDCLHDVCLDLYLPQSEVFMPVDKVLFQLISQAHLMQHI